jgi:hypothetical protein
MDCYAGSNEHFRGSGSSYDYECIVRITYHLVSQLSAFAHLYQSGNTSSFVAPNYRPQQDLNGRSIVSFVPGTFDTYIVD